MRASTTDDNAADDDLDAKDVPFIYGAILRIHPKIKGSIYWSFCPNGPVKTVHIVKEICRSLNLPCQFFRPVPVIAFQKSRNAFENLVSVQAADHNYRISFHHKSHKEGNRDHDTPDADDIHPHDKGRVAASPDDSVVHRHLVGHRNHHDTQNDQKLIGHLLGFRFQTVNRKQRNSDQKQDQSRKMFYIQNKI